MMTTTAISMTRLCSDVGGQRCPNSVRNNCAVSVSQNLKFSVGRVFECPDFEFELDFDRQTPHSKSRQNPDSAVRRRLPEIRKWAVQKPKTGLSKRMKLVGQSGKTGRSKEMILAGRRDKNWTAQRNKNYK